MKPQASTGLSKTFARNYLPWIVVLAAFIAYLSTLNHWIALNYWESATSYATSSGLLQAGRVGGWVWQPQVFEPLYWLLTWPLHWLPQKWMPVGINLFSCVCAAVTLGILARTVCLLPHDRTDLQRQKKHDLFFLLPRNLAWAPPIFAVLVCGLQLTFWEHATVGSNEMLDLLIFAFVILCLLEFRLDGRDGWLSAAAFVFGLGITNNWAMIGFLPLFLIALVWIRGLSFFQVPFLLRMFLCALAGLLLYLALPIARSLADNANIPFWTALSWNVVGQKTIFMTLFHGARDVVLLLSLTSLIPLAIISIRWASYFGDTSRLGIALAKLTFHIVHAVFFVACLWVTLDPPFSPRNKGLGVPFLTLYYLGALCIGYCCGYFLLVFDSQGENQRRLPPLFLWMHRAIAVGSWVLFILVPVMLLYRNAPSIRITNGPHLRAMADSIAKSLPPKATLISDDARRLLMLQAHLSRSGRLNDYVMVDSSLLRFPDYHRFLRKQYGARWPVEMPKGRQQALEPNLVLSILYTLTQSNIVYYLHPSFGYFFEVAYLEPHGLAYQLRNYSTNSLILPLLPPSVLEENERAWDNLERSAIQPLLKVLDARTSDLPQPMRKIFETARLRPEQNYDAMTIATFYSRALNYWGTESQRNGKLVEAGKHFELARRLNEDNIVAEINLAFNQNLQAGKKAAVPLSKSVYDAFGAKYRNWDQVLNANGPFDEPRFCFEYGNVFFEGGNARQAAAQFERVRFFEPENIPVRLALAPMYVRAGYPDEGLKVLQEIKSLPQGARLETNNPIVMGYESSAYLAKGNISNATAIINRSLELQPTNETFLAAAVEVYMNFGVYSNALPLVQKQLKHSPTNAAFLVNEGYLYIQLEKYEEALPPLDKALAMETNNYSALLNRAIANLRTSRLEEARRDYETLQKNKPTEYRFYYGLGEIAYQKRETNVALHNYQMYLTNAPPETSEAKKVKARIVELTPPPP